MKKLKKSLPGRIDARVEHPDAGAGIGCGVGNKECFVDILYLESENFNQEIRRPDSAVFVLCMPRSDDTPLQIRALVACCRAFGGDLLPGFIDSDFIRPFSNRYRIKGTPTFLIFKHGNEIGRLLGRHTPEALTRFAKETLGSDRAENTVMSGK